MSSQPPLAVTTHFSPYTATLTGVVYGTDSRSFCRFPDQRERTLVPKCKSLLITLTIWCKAVFLADHVDAFLKDRIVTSAAHPKGNIDGVAEMTVGSSQRILYYQTCAGRIASA